MFEEYLKLIGGGVLIGVLLEIVEVILMEIAIATKNHRRFYWTIRCLDFIVRHILPSQQFSCEQWKRYEQVTKTLED